MMCSAGRTPPYSLPGMVMRVRPSSDGWYRDEGTAII